jgi:hypothetical protein
MVSVELGDVHMIVRQPEEFREGSMEGGCSNYGPIEDFLAKFGCQFRLLPHCGVFGYLLKKSFRYESAGSVKCILGEVAVTVIDDVEVEEAKVLFHHLLLLLKLTRMSGPVDSR